MAGKNRGLAVLVPLNDVEAIVKWTEIRHLPYFDIQALLAQKMKNGLNCARKKTRAQDQAVIKLVGEIGNEFSPEAKKALTFARSWQRKHRANFHIRTRKFGRARIGEIILQTAA